MRLAEGAVGEHLRRLHPREVVSFALVTQEGEYTAYDGAAQEMKTYPLLPGPRGSVEYLLHLSGHPILALDLRPARDAAAGGGWLRAPRYHRNIGLTPADLGFYPAAMTHDFDALFFVDRTRATRPIEASP